ncbi:MAG: hypothetical protein KJ058_12135 [Thermoanaerobaculia bacterium]|nr:hypothetical protein [Thermoanaerobaculia bacterium]
MDQTISLDVRLRGFVRRAGRRWIALCPAVHVATQGKDRAGAERALQEAVELWFESCVERGTLDQALRECGFRPRAWTGAGEVAESHERVLVARSAAETDVRGAEFDLRVSVPAYQAARFLDERPGPAPA